jgi:misacylated tRNA(Ala) deacylase
MTEEVFREDSYVRSCEATVIKVGDNGIVLDRTVFYPEGGGQPGDSGVLRTADGRGVPITNTSKDHDSGDCLHVPADGAPVLAPGDVITAEIDWDRRHRLMRMHTCLHLLCAVIDGGVTGGSVGTDKGRLDFDLPDTSLDKEAITEALNGLIAADHPLTPSWISDAELASNPQLVRTMSVKPPSGQGQVRVIDITGVDLQPCGGTHVRSTGEVGPVRIGKIENKGRQNRRVNVHFVDGS